MRAQALRLGAFKSDPGRAPAMQRVQSWTRTQFDLPPDAPVMVTELECMRPGCPPLETVVAFWLADGDRRHFRVRKAMADVVAGDLPPVWLKEFLCAEPEDPFGCC